MARRRAMLDRTAETEAEKLRITKVCPKLGCGNRIERSGGCAHMECRGLMGCGTHFCWICKVIWKNGGNDRLHLDSCDMRLGNATNRIPREQLDASPDKSLYAEGWDEDPKYDKAQDSDAVLYRYG